MTIVTENRKQSFETNGVTVDFPFDFNALDVGEIYALTVDDDGVETDYTNFSVVLNTSTSGGVLTTGDVLDNVELLVYRETDLTQEVDYQNGGRFPAESHEQALDKLIQIAQEQQEELDRSLKGTIAQPLPFSLDPKLVDDELLFMQSQVIKSSGTTKSDLEDAIEDAINAADEAYRAANATGGIDKGDYENDPLIEVLGEYVVYQRGVSPTQWKIIEGTPLPYQINSTTYPNPSADPNLQAYSPSDYGELPSGITIQHRRGTNTEIMASIPSIGELLMNRDANELILGDGVTVGGHIVTVRKSENIAALKLRNFTAGEFVSTRGYYSQNDGGEGFYVIKTAAQATSDGDPMDDVINVELSNNNWAILIPVLNEINALQAGILNDGSDQWEKIYNLESFVFQKPFDVFWPEGTYDVGVRNWPFRDTSLTPTSFRDYKNITLRGAGKSKTIFSTTSVDGADVLQLNAVEGITVKDLSLKATGTGSAAGSNGVSITNGGKNIDIDVDCVDLFYVVKPTYVDGGKAFTLQNGVNTTLPYENIKIRGNGIRCPYSVEISVTFDTFQTISGKNFKNVDIEVGAEDCWIGSSAGASEPTGIVDGADLGSDVRVVVNAVNCAKPQSVGRWCGGEFKTNVLNTKSKSQLFRPLPTDQDVIAQTVITAFYVDAEVAGIMKEADHKLKIGGGTNGGFGLSGATIKSKVRNSISAPFVVGNEVDVVDVGGNTAANCQINIGNVTDGTGTELFTATNFVIYNELLKANIESKSVKVKRDGQIWDTFRAESGSDSIGIARLGSGSAGVVDGFAIITDTISGTNYKIQLYT